MTIQAAVLHAMDAKPPFAEPPPLSAEEVDLEAPGPGEILVRIGAAGLCHCDLSVINGHRPRPTPMALGHEAAGIVEALGEGVTDLQRGEHGVLAFVPSGGHCEPCAEGRPALREPWAAANGAGRLLSGARRLSRNGQPIHHPLGCSVFAEYATVSRSSVVRIDRDLPLDEAALFGCALLTGAGVAVNTAQLRAGSSLAIIGPGGVGLASLQGAKVAGARQIVAVGLADAKLELAKALGATDTINAGNPDGRDEIRQATGGGAFAFEFTGSLPALELAYGLPRRGGMTVTAGLPPPVPMFPPPPFNRVAEERPIKECYIGTRVPARDIPRYIDLYRRGKLAVSRLTSRRLKLEDINRGFDLLNEGKAARQIVALH